MASEYWNWKFRDVKPDPPEQYTSAQKRRNWWHYHKWHLLLGAVLLIVGVDILRGALGLGVTEPDYQVAYVGTFSLPEDTAAALQTALARFGTDCNGDGAVTVQLHQYVSAQPADASAPDSDSAYYAYASEVTLMADLEGCESAFFLLEDPVAFQRDYEALCRTDGSPLSAWDTAPQSYALSWTDCPVLSGLELGTFGETVSGETVSGSGQERMSGLYFARRASTPERHPDHPEACAALWDALTKGAKP